MNTLNLLFFAYDLLAYILNKTGFVKPELSQVSDITLFQAQTVIDSESAIIHIHHVLLNSDLL